MASGETGVVETPFNLECILRGCPNLYREWKKHPFYFDLNKKGKIVVKYVKVTPGKPICFKCLR